jgi:hypothetical protein
MYSTGQGTDVDQGKAFSWYLKAAENGAAGGQCQVARLYRDGVGVAKDLTSSYAWLLVLRSQRDHLEPESSKLLEELFASVEVGLSEQDKVTARATAQRTLRSITRAYLEAFRR